MTVVTKAQSITAILGFLVLFNLAGVRAASPAETEIATTPPPQIPHTVAGDDNKVLLPSLKGLVFIASRDALRKNGRDDTGIVTTDVPDISADAFAAIMEPYIGQPVTLASLREITRKTVLYLRQHDRPLVDVMMPEQDISSGTVQILVLEGRLGKVEVEGNEWFPRETYVAAIRTQPGEVIAGRKVLEDVGWLNQNPFRRVDLVYSRGEKSGETNIILRAHDRKPWRFYGGLDDTGNELTDQLRINLGVNAGNLFGKGYQGSYQLSASPDFDKMVSNVAMLVMPLPSRHTLTVFGSYATSRPDLPDQLFALEGKAWQLSGRYRFALPEMQHLEQDITIGLDIKTTNNDLAFGGTRVLDQSTQVIQLLGDYGVHRNWDSGNVTNAEAVLALSPGGITDKNSDAAFKAARSYASADYAYLNLHVEHIMPLSSGVTWNLRGSLQWASTNLLPSEQLGLGGRGSVRGFEEREVNGDSGVQFSSEWVWPAIRRHGIPGDLRFLAFVDGGQASINKPVPGERDSISILGAGFGFDYNFGSNIRASLVWGQQLKQSHQSPVDQHGRVHFGITVAY